MEIFVGNDGLDTLECQVCGGFLTGQHTGGVENVEALILHGAHVEVVHRHNHEDIEVVLTTIDLFIPAHGAFQRVHGVIALLGIARLHVHAQINVTARARGKGITFLYQVSGHQGEEVAGLGERVFPGDKMPAVFQLAFFHIVAVREKDRIGVLVGFDAGSETCHHVRTVREESNAAEAFCLTLGTEHAGGFVQTFQAGIILGLNPGHHGQRELLRYRANNKLVAPVLIVSRSQVGTIQGDGFQRQTVAVKLQRCRHFIRFRVAANVKRAVHTRPVFKELEPQVYGVDQIRRHLVIAQINGLWLAGTHWFSPEFAVCRCV